MPGELLVGFDSTTGNGHPPVRPNDDEQAMNRLMGTIRAVKTWALTVEHRLLKACLATEPDGLRLFVIARTPEYDFELTKAASAVSILLSDAGLDLGVSQIPTGTPDELQAFLDPDAAILSAWR